jgi:hypothetical protein
MLTYNTDSTASTLSLGSHHTTAGLRAHNTANSAIGFYGYGSFVTNVWELQTVSWTPLPNDRYLLSLWVNDTMVASTNITRPVVTYTGRLVFGAWNAGGNAARQWQGRIGQSAVWTNWVPGDTTNLSLAHGSTATADVQTVMGILKYPQ